jgi:hypothetical protein
MSNPRIIILHAPIILPSSTGNFHTYKTDYPNNTERQTQPLLDGSYKLPNLQRQ